MAHGSKQFVGAGNFMPGRPALQKLFKALLGQLCMRTQYFPKVLHLASDLQIVRIFVALTGVCVKESSLLQAIGLVKQYGNT